MKIIKLNILFTFNNVLCTITNIEGDTLFWISAGTKKNQGAKKVTLVVIISMLKLILERLIKLKTTHVHLNLNGFDKNKKIVLKYFKQSFLNILSITNNSKFSHNGCKKLKKRSV
uniref:ribosomal protein S11 n=1 Tax=Gracilaria urvillei TaxID=172974 RepID=UPI001D11B405|nr:ribosomal protein S11 [Hydropuntia urvillei]UAD89855.1 ribosomal protein S11 [Hydropuntia urvillei]